MQAAEKYDPDAHEHIHFVSYARYWIKQQAFRDAAYDKQVRVPLNTKTAFRRILKFVDQFKRKYGKEPSCFTISVYTGLSENSIQHIMRDVQLLRFL